MGPAKAAANDPGDEVPMPSVRPVVSPPAKVEVPNPFTFRRFEIENDVDDAIGRMEEPVTLSPPARMVSPVETLSPFEEARPDEESPPVKVEVPVPVDTIFPPVRRRSPTVDSMPEVDLRPAEEMPPVKVEVAAPETVMMFATLKLVVEATGKTDALVVEVATKVEAVAFPSMMTSPVTPSLAPGEVVPMPRLPFASTTILGAAAPAV